MKSSNAALFVLSVLASTPGLLQRGFAQPRFAQAPVSASAIQPSPASDISVQEETPAQQRIEAAKQQIKADPKKVQAYNELAAAYLRRARETADRAYLREADVALAQGLKLDSADFQLQKTEVTLFLSRDQSAQALERATVLHRRTPDDVMLYGYIAEANIALGHYAEAETNAQWMINMRPNNNPALLVAAKLRSLYGDVHGAIEFLNIAYSQTSPVEVEELAWILNQIASLEIDSGQIDAASELLQQAEQLFPRYPATTENMARLRMTQHRSGESAQLWRQASAVDDDPHVLYQLAKAQDAAGQTQNARNTFARFEKLANASETTTDNGRLDLVLMKAENPATALDALKLAHGEVQARQDVWTLDAYAWALYANGQYQQANAEIQKATSVGVQSAQIYDHAGHIAERLNLTADAAKYFELAAQTNPSSSFPVNAAKFASPTADAQRNDQAIPQSEFAPSATQARLPASNSPAPAAFAPVPDVLLTPQPTLTSRSIRDAQTIVTRNSKDAKAYAGLGAAYFQRARETGDIGDYQLAEDSVNKSLDLVSADFSADAALGTMAEICMGEHRFGDALRYAQKALSLGTGDVSPFAIVGDAYADMGEYDKAAAAYSRLTPRDMTLSPRAAYARDSRLSYLKFIAGDTTAAILLMKTAVSEGVEAQLPSENLAWLYYELGEYETQAGDAASADAAYVQALNIHPGDYRSLASLARLRANNGRYTEAIVLYQKAIAVVPMPIFIAELGDLYSKSGNQSEAEKQYALVEYIGLLGHINQVLHNRDLAIFYADHDIKLTESLDLAQKELEVRHDIYTWDVLAWALYKNGKLTEAAQASDNAMKFGTQDPLLLFHAGVIAEGLGRHDQARTEMERALQINPYFHLLYAAVARQTLAALQVQAQSTGDSNADAR